MKRKILLGAALLALNVSFGQTLQNTATFVQTASQSIETTKPNQSGTLSSTEKQVTQSLQNNHPVDAGQHVCKTHELNEQHYADRGILQSFNQSYLTSAQQISNNGIPEVTGTNNISVIFHVVHNPNNPAENVSNALIMQVFNDLTDDYLLLNTDAGNARPPFTPANAGINFCLATQDPAGNPLTEVGVIRVATSEDWYDSDNGEENKMKSSATGGSDIWDRNDYLNVWICDISNGAGSGTAGYAYRPTTTYLPSASIDGIVLDYNLGMNNDNVLTHEVGHYLGLDHTWGGSGGCTNDDGFGDTPVTDGPSFNYPGSCSGSQQTCAGTETQYENYMDYANCTVMFTQNQADYMNTILNGIRSSLALSNGCDPTNTPPISAFTSIPTGPAPVVIAQGATVNLIDQSTNVPTGWTWTISGTQGTDWAYVNGTSSTSQNPTVEFYTVGLYDVSLAASNAYGTDATPASETGYIQVVAPAVGTACDTLRNWDPADAALNGYTYYSAGSTNGAWGYIPGHNLMDLYGNGSSMENTLQYAEKYNYAGTAQVRRISMPIFIAEDNSGAGTIELRVYADDVGTTPGTILATETINIADINAGAWNEFDFTTPASVTGNFWVGFAVNYGAPQDTVLVGVTATIAGGVSGWYQEMDTYGWLDAGLIGITESMAIDVMLSNGPAPVADFTATDGDICVGGSITANGASSTNTTNYYWYQTDDPFTTVIDNSNSASATFTFPTTGNYAIYLFADGSCMTDAVYLPLTVFDAVTATVTPTATTCGVNNGSITVSGETGGDGTYYYSLDGINYQTTGTFSNLAAGDYDVHVATIGDACETIYTVTVNGSTALTASSSVNSSICPGGSTMITASGGNNYEWYDGATLIASTASTTVSPSSNTQYSCVVTDALGCEATVYTTVNVYTPPTAPVITPSGSTTICSGTTVDLTSSYPTGNVWSTTETSSSITVSTTDNYTVTYTDGNGCSSTSAPMAITVTTPATIALGFQTDPTSCGTATGEIEITGTGSGNVSWTGTATGSATGVTLPYTITGLVAGSYQISFVDGTGCSSNTVNGSLSDPTPPTAPTITPSGATTFCDGNSVTLTSSYGTGNVWSTAETSNAITVSSTATVSVTYTDGSGCSATSAPITITVNNNPAPPVITPSGATTFCSGNSVTLTSSQGSGNAWVTGETTQSIVVSTTSSIYVTYTNSNGCSATSATTDIVVNETPDVNPITSQELCDGENASLTTFTGSVTGTTFDWTNNNTSIGLAGSGSGDIAAFTATNSGTSVQTAVIVVTPSTGSCVGNTETFTITVNPLPTVDAGTYAQMCLQDAAFTLSNGTPTGGTYSGPGISTNMFDPAAAGTGTQNITYSYSDVTTGCSNTATTSIVVVDCAGIEDVAISNVKVYPNPSSSILNIETEGQFEINIIDNQGRVIESSKGTDLLTIDINHLEAALYYVQITTATGTNLVKVIKE